MSRFDALVKTQVDRAMATERKEYEMLKKQLQEKDTDIEMLKQQKEHADQKIKEL